LKGWESRNFKILSKLKIANCQELHLNEHWDREQSNYVLNLTLSKKGYKDKEISIEKNVLYIHYTFIGFFCRQL